MQVPEHHTKVTLEVMSVSHCCSFEYAMGLVSVSLTSG